MDLQSELEHLPLRGAETIEIAPSALTLPDISTGSDIVTLSASDANLNGSDLLSESSDSDDSDSETKEGETKYSFLGKRQRCQPVKFETEFSPSRTPKTTTTEAKPASTGRKTRQRKNLEPPTTPAVTPIPLKRGTRCGKCAGCMREDCAKCVYCLDKAKFGGPGKKKQRCILRTCSNFEHKKGCNPSYLKKASDSSQKILSHYVQKASGYGCIIFVIICTALSL